MTYFHWPQTGPLCAIRENHQPRFLTEPIGPLGLTSASTASGEHPMPYYLGKVPLQAELPELAEEVTAAQTSPQQEWSANESQTPCGHLAVDILQCMQYVHFLHFTPSFTPSPAHLRHQPRP